MRVRVAAGAAKPVAARRSGSSGLPSAEWRVEGGERSGVSGWWWTGGGNGGRGGWAAAASRTVELKVEAARVEARIPIDGELADRRRALKQIVAPREQQRIEKHVEALLVLLAGHGWVAEGVGLAAQRRPRHHALAVPLSEPRQGCGRVGGHEEARVRVRVEVSADVPRVARRRHNRSADGRVLIGATHVQAEHGLAAGEVAMPKVVERLLHVWLELHVPLQHLGSALTHRLEPRLVVSLSPLVGEAAIVVGVNGHSRLVMQSPHCLAGQSACLSPFERRADLLKVILPHVGPARTVIVEVGRSRCVVVSAIDCALAKVDERVHTLPFGK